MGSQHAQPLPCSRATRLGGRAEGLKQAHSSYVDNVERERREREQRRQNDERRRREDVRLSPPVCGCCAAGNLSFRLRRSYLLSRSCLDHGRLTVM